MKVVRRFDGRTIRVDKASDTGPRGGYGGRGGGGGGFGQRGGGYMGSPQVAQMPQMPFGVHPQQGYPMASHPMYAAAQPYGRGGYAQPVPQYGAAPQQQGKEDQFRRDGTGQG